jgi:hypothetical protein
MDRSGRGARYGGAWIKKSKRPGRMGNPAGSQ